MRSKDGAAHSHTFLRPEVMSDPLLMEAKSAERPSSAATALGSSITIGGGGGMPATGVHNISNGTKAAQTGLYILGS